MTTLTQKIQAEHRVREWLRSQDMPEPDEVEYGFTCVRFFFHESKTCLVFDIDEIDEIDAESGRGLTFGSATGGQLRSSVFPGVRPSP